MYVDQIRGNSNTNFAAIKKISCSTGVLLRSINEDRIAHELKKCVKQDKFFEKYDVKAYIQVYDGNASLKLKYKTVANNFLEKLMQFFKKAKTIELIETSDCSIDSTYYLAKRMRKLDSFENLVDNN